MTVMHQGSQTALGQAAHLKTGLVVQKYGGSSVGSVERIQLVANRVAQARRRHKALVVVVSAMSGETDRLLSLAQSVSSKAAGREPSGREIDQLVATGEQVSAALLALALQERGIPARSLTGAQMRLRTDGIFTRARIQSLDCALVSGLLDDGLVVVATGFQGIDAHGNLTTLGRGGSDTSAVAIAAALNADECEIYTDVSGVFTADPRVCPMARKLDAITFDEMMEMASLGAKVLQIRSVELAMNHRIPLRVRSTFSDDPGTLVQADAQDIERLNVRGISHAKNETKLTLRRVPDQPGVAARVFTSLAGASINVDVIVQNISEAGTTDLSFTVGSADRRQAEDIVRRMAQEVGAHRYEVSDDIGKVSIVGVGMMSHPGVAATMFEALHQAGVNIQIITTSEIKVTCVVDRDAVERAVNALHAAFALHAPSKQKSAPRAPEAAVAKKRSRAAAASKANGNVGKANESASPRSSSTPRKKPASRKKSARR